jgi:D-alanyl-D-alanine carboxypeptidase
MIKITQSSTRNIGTTASLKFRHWILLKDLFYGILLPSGNDAAHLIAEVIGFVLYQAKRDPEFSLHHLH